MDRDIIRIFICQPMDGAGLKEICQERERAITIAKAKLMNELPRGANPKFEVLDATLGGPVSGQRPALYMLGHAIQIMSHADIVVFAKDWAEWRGCRMEHRAAYAYGLKILDLDTED